MDEFQELTRLARFIAEHELLLLFLGLGSALTFIGTLVMVPWLVVRIPEDYFLPRERPPVRLHGDRHISLQILLLVCKNLLGVLFIALGIVMLVLPGQGLLTILAGLILLDFPGKFRFERTLICQPAIQRSINWLRRRANRPPLRLDRESAD